MNQLSQQPAVNSGVNIGDAFGSPWGRSLSLANMVSNIIIAAMSIAGVITIFLFIFGGFKIISGAGGGDSKSTAEGKQAITWATIGFIIIFASYWIVQLLQSITGYRLF